ncbi:MAG: DNA topoisomerase IB [Bryobacteraceae bacterium]|nr:DNA topoisomerase IB [Bryobacteraceae bacterium]
MPVDPVDSAKQAGLRHVSDSSPGIRRKRSGKGFAYIGPDGRAIRDRDELRRIRALAIPPAWTDVWICPAPRGHLQAVGRDARGRKQYRYHARYREVRDATKFGRMAAFAAALPAIRRRVEQDLGRPGLPKEKVLATVVRLLETTLARVGNDEYAKDNNSFGLTTLRDRHVEIEGRRLSFRFKGKSGQEHRLELHDARLARIVKRCRELPGYRLLQYIDEEGGCCDIDSGDVNDYLREISGDDFTAKDFRTWAGTLLAARTLAECGVCRSAAAASKNIVLAVKSVAQRLGNRPATCRKYYVHPVVLDAYAEGILLPALDHRRAIAAAPGAKPSGLSTDELCVLGLIADGLQPGRSELRRKAS